MSDFDEILEIVDENNNVIGQAPRLECYKKGLLHRAVNIFVFNSKGEVFLQKRSAKKFGYPLYWDLSCSEHVKPGESFIDAAKRGLQEELGINADLEELLPIHRIDNTDESKNEKYLDSELMVTFKAVYNGEMKFDLSEVAEGKFFNIKDLPEPMTPWFLEDWSRLNRDWKLLKS